MTSETASTIQIDRNELPSMVATLCSYESWLGPYHPQTLCLATEVAIAYWQAGKYNQARPLLERMVRDLGRHLGSTHDLRMRAITTLRDLLLAQHEYGRAGVLQAEILECQTGRLGSQDLQTHATRANLATILLEHINTDTREV